MTARTAGRMALLALSSALLAACEQKSVAPNRNIPPAPIAAGPPAPAPATSDTASSPACTDERPARAAEYTRVHESEGKQPPPGRSTPDRKRRYEALLRRLGAIAVGEIDAEADNGGALTQYREKGVRRDVHGWLSRSLAERVAEKSIAAPSASECRAAIDVGEYRRTRDPLLWTAMLFAIDELADQPASRANRAVLLSAYRAQ